MQINADDGKNRKFIMIQIPEPTNEKSTAYKEGYKNISEIGQDRIIKAGKIIKKESGALGQNLDIGFRVLKLDTSNMNDVFYNPANLSQNLLDQLVGNVKEDRTPLDLLFQVMLELGIELSAKIEEKNY
jgi:adenine-specific DNA-methyltransferase